MSTQEVVSSQTELEQQIAGLRRLTQRLAIRNSIAMATLWVVTVLVAALFIYIIIRLIVLGAPTLFSATFYGTSEAGIAPQLFNTFYILILTELFLFPIASIDHLHDLFHLLRVRRVVLAHRHQELLHQDVVDLDLFAP